LGASLFGVEQGLGVVAAALVVALWFLLPAGSERRLVRQPLLFLILYASACAGQRALPEEAPGSRVLPVAGALFLFAALGRGSVLLVLDVILSRRMQQAPPRIVRDVAQAVVWAVVVLATLRRAGVEPGSLLTTSALLTAAVALSLQETLGNLIAGLAIQVQRPFDVGDWIQFDADKAHIGRVLEINWRATKVLTLDDVEVVVPNATLAKAPIANFTKPTKVSRRSIFLTVTADVPPHVVHSAVLDALVGSFGVAREPAPSVVTNAFVDGNVEYWVRIFTDAFHKRDVVDGTARDRIWYALRRIGVTPASPPNRAIAVEEVATAIRAREEEELAARGRALRSVDFLAVLPEEMQRRLAAASAVRLYVEGEAIVKKGEASAQMFVVEAGEVTVELHDVELARLGPGQFFGEMALMTGEPRNATVRARGPCRLLVIDAASLRAVLEAAPDSAVHISRVIAERQAALAQGPAAEQEALAGSTEERTSLLLGRIRKFFSL
jgi:small-conductance mechanosensitive channel/CRP-like cAMP-binding protein